MPKKQVSETTDTRSELQAFLDSAAPKQKEVIVEVDGHTLRFNVTTSRPIGVRTKMVMDVVDMMFIDDLYVPTMEEFATCVNLLIYYTDVNVDELTIEQVEALCGRPEIFDAIKSAIDDDMVVVSSCIYHMVEWRKQQMLHAKADQLFDAATSLISSLERVLGQVESADIGKTDELLEAAKAIAAKSERELGRGIIEFREAQKASEPKSRVVRKKKAQAATTGTEKET